MQSKVETTLRSFQIVNYSGFAGLTWLLYDWGHILPKEIKYFWHGAWTLPRFVYFFNRYIALVETVFLLVNNFYPISMRLLVLFQFPSSPAHMNRTTIGLGAYWFRAILGSLQVWALWVLLILRLHALYSNKKLLWSMLVLFFLSATAMLAITLETTTHTPITNEPLPGIFNCVIDPARRKLGIIWAWWLPPLVIESYLFILALLQLTSNLRYIKKDALIWAKPKYIIEIVLRDSIWYFASVLCIDVATMFLWQHPPKHVSGGARWTISLIAPFLAFVASRLSLDIHEFHAQRLVSEEGIGLAGRVRLPLNRFDDAFTVPIVSELPPLEFASGPPNQVSGDCVEMHGAGGVRHNLDLIHTPSFELSTFSISETNLPRVEGCSGEVKRRSGSITRPTREDA